MRRYTFIIIPLIFTALGFWIGYYNWWFTPFYIILGASGVGGLFLKQDPLNTPRYLMMEYVIPTLFASLIGFISLTIYLFIVASTWWIVLILFLFIVLFHKFFFGISSFIILFIPTAIYCR